MADDQEQPVSVHKPVLLKEVLEYLAPQPGQFIIDGTVDGGGHAAAIIEAIGPTGMLLGLDWDEQLLERCKARFRGSNNAMLVHANYAEVSSVLAEVSAARPELAKADGLLIDLGFSSEQIEASGRGFSFGDAARNEPLLMTYDDERMPVWQILREKSESVIADIIYEFGGERASRKIAKAIKERGRRAPIMTAGDLADTVRIALTGSADAKSRGRYEHGRIDPATRTFQALRIYANGELENLKTLLNSVSDVVKLGGRVVIITFHSVEDGIVKQAFRAMSREKRATVLTKKPVEASWQEVKENSRSRSAKIRAVQII